MLQMLGYARIEQCGVFQILNQSTYRTNTLVGAGVLSRP